MQQRSPSMERNAPITHIIGAGLAGLAAAVRLAEQGRPVAKSTKRQDRRGGAAAPILMPASGPSSTMAITCFCLAMAPRSGISPSSAELTDYAVRRGRSSILRTLGPGSVGRSRSMKAAGRPGFLIAAGACRRRSRSIISLPRRSCGQGAGERSPTSSPAKALFTSAFGSL